MAQRIGKYKITKREDSMNLSSDRNVSGVMKFDSVVGNPTNLTGSSGAFTGVAGTLVEGTHAGRLLYAPDFNANSTLTIPTATRAGVTYHIVSAGVADDAHNLVINASSADAVTFSGGIIDFDEDEAGAAQVSVVYPGADDDKLTLAAPHNYNLTFVATSTTNYLVTGWHVGDTPAVFGDQ
jgi:hypothetical protein